MKSFFKRYVSICVVLLMLLTIMSGCALEKAQPKTQYKIEATEVQEQQTYHSHNWSCALSDKQTIEETVELQSVASEGINTVYLIRDIEVWGRPEGSDYYIAYDKYFHEIVVRKRYDNEIVIECITDGVPRMERYSVSESYCTICGESKRENAELYKFYIPEGTYLISH